MPKEQQNKPVPQQGDAPINEEQAAARTAEQAAEVMDLVQESKADADVKASAKWFLFKAELNGKVSTARENTRTTNQTAKYQVHVSASQQPPTEGLSKLMDIMASCVEPLDKTNSDNNSNS